MSDLQKIWIEGYRSVYRLRLALDRVTMVNGPNGAGKTNLYRAVELFADAARGQFLRRFAEEGGLAFGRWGLLRKVGADRTLLTDGH